MMSFPFMDSTPGQHHHSLWTTPHTPLVSTTLWTASSPGQHHPLSTRGRYESYWNDCLFQILTGKYITMEKLGPGRNIINFGGI